MSDIRITAKNEKDIEALAEEVFQFGMDYEKKTLGISRTDSELENKLCKLCLATVFSYLVNFAMPQEATIGTAYHILDIEMDAIVKAGEIEFFDRNLFPFSRIINNLKNTGADSPAITNWDTVWMIAMMEENQSTLVSMSVILMICCGFLQYFRIGKTAH